MLRYFKNQNGLEIHHNGDLPSRSGFVGSSSAFVVGFLKSYETFVIFAYQRSNNKQ